MSKKMVIVGGVAGGATAAARLRRQSEEDEIIMFERGPHVSFSNCSLPYHLSGVVEDADDLVLMNPAIFKKQYNIDARVNSEVISIDREHKTVRVRDLQTKEIYEQGYDELILSTGAAPIVPNIPGIELVDVYTVRNVVDIDRLRKSAAKDKEQSIAVIGGGFIGIEVAENLKKAGFDVTVIEAMPQILRPFDYDMVQIFHKELLDQGIHLIVNDKVESFEKNCVVLGSDRRIKADMVIMAIGVAPETTLAKEAGLEIGISRGIKVDHNYRTSDPFIYAVGDAVEVYHALTHRATTIALAGPALKQAHTAADHIHNRISANKGYIGSSAIQVFRYNGASTGLTEGLIEALKLQISYGIVRIILSDKVGLMPDASPTHVKLLYEVPSGKILGAQAIGKGDVTKRMDVIATVIKFSGTLDDLKDLELCYAPPFSTAKDLVNYAGYVGSNLLNQDYSQVNVDKVRELVESGAVIIDVREVSEYERGHVKGARNIPLSQLRERYQEIPKEVPVYVHCRTGQRSYNAVRALINLGYQNAINITGSFLGISLFEYYNDVTMNREPIVTNYNFN
ncbi:MAG: FAD-dependent oxidoreductase [Lachnospiraceae bacterium]